MSKRKERPGIMLYFELISVLEELTDAQRGRLLYGALCYGQTGQAPNLDGDPILKAIWPFVASRADSDGEKYSKQCRKSHYKGKYSRYATARRNRGQDCLSFYDWLEREGVNPETFEKTPPD